MDRRCFLQSFGAAALPQAAAPGKPNVIIILADDQGWGDVGCYGSPHIRTPHLDRMASQGVRFTDFYAQPLCGPSRAALLTGCYPVRNSLNFNHLPRARTGIHPGEVTIAEMLKPQGYATMIAGKWHLGDAPPFRPMRHGFDHWFGLPYSNDMWPFHPKVERVGQESARAREVRERAELTGFDGQGQHYPPDWFPTLPLMRNDEVMEMNPDESRLTARYTEESLRFIRENRRRPFFLYLAHAMPHVPLFPGEAFRGRSMRGRYGDVIEELDDSTGRLLAELKAQGIDENTLVVYLSDNGPWAPYGIDAGSAGPLRGAKGSVWEGGIRVPAIFRWPGRVAAGAVCSEIAATIDLLPTIAGATGAALPRHEIDGVSLLPLLERPAGKSPREHFLYFGTQLQYKAGDGRPENTANLLAVRQGPWKLHLGPEKALYQLREDTGEQFNVAARNPEVVRGLEGIGSRFLAGLRPRPLGRLDG